MGTNQDDEIEIDLKELFFVMRRKLWVLILAGMLGAAVSGIFTATMMKPVYTSSTMLYIVNKTTTLTSLTDLQLGSQLTKDYKVLVTSRPVTGKVIENLDLNLDHEQLLKKITVANPQDTRILTISVEDNDPYMAKAIADEMASVAAGRMAEIMDTAPPNIVEEGYVPTRQTSPSLVKNTAIGGMAGLFLAAVIVLAVFVMNDTIKTPEDVEKYLQLTVLGTIPVFETGDGKKGKKKKSRRKRKADRLREETEDRLQGEIAGKTAGHRDEETDDGDREDIMPHQVSGKRKNQSAERDLEDRKQKKEQKQETSFENVRIDESGKETGEKAGWKAGEESGERAGWKAGGESGEKAGGESGGKAGGEAGGKVAGGKVAGEKAAGEKAAGEKAGGESGEKAGGESGGKAGEEAGEEDCWKAAGEKTSGWKAAGEKASDWKAVGRNAVQIRKADRETYVKRADDSDDDTKALGDNMPGRRNMGAVMDMEHGLPEKTVKPAGGQEKRSSAVERQTVSAGSVEEELAGADLDEFVQRIMKQALGAAEKPKEDTDHGTD